MSKRTHPTLTLRDAIVPLLIGIVVAVLVIVAGT